GSPTAHGKRYGPDWKPRCKRGKWNIRSWLSAWRNSRTRWAAQVIVAPPPRRDGCSAGVSPAVLASPGPTEDHGRRRQADRCCDSSGAGTYLKCCSPGSLDATSCCAAAPAAELPRERCRYKNLAL